MLPRSRNLGAFVWVLLERAVGGKGEGRGWTVSEGCGSGEGRQTTGFYISDMCVIKRFCRNPGRADALFLCYAYTDRMKIGHDLVYE